MSGFLTIASCHAAMADDALDVNKMNVDFGFIIFVPFSPHCRDWSSFAWKVLSSWQNTTVFERLSCVGASMSAGMAFCASSVGALVKCKKPIFTIFRRNVSREATTSGRSCPSMTIPYFGVSTSNPQW